MVLTPLSIDPAEFVSKFYSIPEGSLMYFTSSAEYAHMLALVLKEDKTSQQIQNIKEITNEEINTPLSVVESDAMRWLAVPSKKVIYDYPDGSVKKFTVDELYKMLKNTRLQLSSFVMAMIKTHADKFDFNLDSVQPKQRELKKDFTKPRKRRLLG